MRSRERGLTLIEILLVLAIIGLITGLAIYGLGGVRQSEVARSVNQFAMMLRFGFDKARVDGRHMRLEIDLDAGRVSLQQAASAFYLPATDRDGKILVLDERKLRDREDRDKRAAEQYLGSVASRVMGDQAGVDPYAVIPTAVPRLRPPVYGAFDTEGGLTEVGAPLELPEGLRVVSVQTDADPEPIVSGKAAIYFFPRGQTQHAHIQLKDERGDGEYTITVQPLTGKVQIESALIAFSPPNVVDEAPDDLGRRMERRSW